MQGRQQEMLRVDAAPDSALVMDDVAFGDFAVRLPISRPMSRFATTAPDVFAAIAVLADRHFVEDAVAHVRGGRTTNLKSLLYPSLRRDGGSDPKENQSDVFQSPALMHSVTCPS